MAEVSTHTGQVKEVTWVTETRYTLDLDRNEIEAVRYFLRETVRDPRYGTSELPYGSLLAAGGRVWEALSIMEFDL